MGCKLGTGHWALWAVYRGPYARSGGAQNPARGSYSNTPLTPSRQSTLAWLHLVDYWNSVTHSVPQPSGLFL